MARYILEKWRGLGRLCRHALGLGFAAALVAAVLVAHAFTDGDGDGMDDSWEVKFSLNPEVDDGSLDPDGDSLTNYAEYVANTDPFSEDSDIDGWGDAVDGWVSRAFSDWGNPQFTSGDFLDYTAPEWWISAFKTGGTWETNAPTAWHVDASDTNLCELHIKLDRAFLTNDLVLEMTFLDHTNASLYMDLLDTNLEDVVTDLFGNLLSGSGQTNTVSMNLPFETNANAAIVCFRRGSGEITIYDSILYVDEDGDGLDADQEQQLGTSDHNADSDGDNLGDYAEVFTHGTDPANSDTDADGMRDGDEVFYGNSPTNFHSYAALPFIENFESNTVSIGDLNGQNGWTVSPTDGALVQTNLFSSDPDGGDQAVKFDSSSSLAVAQHLFAAPSGSVVWADWHVKVKRGNPPDGATNSAAGLGFNADGRLNVWDGDSNNWVTLTNHTPVADGSEVRLTVRLDYAQQKWLVCLDGLLRAQNLGFGSNPGSFSSFSAQGREGAIDGIRITVTEPDDISADGDNLPDSWEIEYFGDLDETDSGNPDSDDLTNLQEYQRGTDPTLADTDGDGLTDGAEVNTYGTNPLLADTDSDGMNDGNEVFYGENPTNPVNSVAYAALPFIENFETNTVNLGSLHGQNDWTVSPTDGAQVQTNALYEGEGAQAVVFDTEASGGATAIHLVASSNSLVWADWHVQVKQGPPAAAGTNSVAALGFNTDGRLTVWNGTSGEWVVLTNHTPLAEGTWVRLSVQMDYTKQKWLVCLNSTNVAENIGFGSTVGAFSSFAAKGPEGRMDALAVTATQPDGLHVDEDNLPDSWEMQYFGNLDQVDSGDPDGDSLTNLEEYELGTNPANADSDGDGMMDGDEVAAYANPLLADSDGDGVVDGSDSTPIFADHPVGEGPALTILDPENESLILW